MPPLATSDALAYLAVGLAGALLSATLLDNAVRAALARRVAFFRSLGVDRVPFFVSLHRSRLLGPGSAYCVLRTQPAHGATLNNRVRAAQLPLPFGTRLDTDTRISPSSSYPSTS